MSPRKREAGKQLPFFAENEVTYHTAAAQTRKPIRTFSKESLIDELLKIHEMGWVENTRKGNAGSVGNVLEDLLGIEENNLPIPNATEWELKSQRINSTALTTLFHMEPSPRAIKFVPAIFLQLYGWPHEKAGARYDASEMSFRQTISGAHPSDRGFKVVVDRASGKVVVSFDANSVAAKHEGWLADVAQRVGLGELAPQPYWGFDDLRSKAGTKLPNCFYVQAEVNSEGDKEFFKYSKVTMLQGFNIDGLLNGLERGNVYIDFDARTGHNHGTKFRLRQNMLPVLYSQITEIF